MNKRIVLSVAFICLVSLSSYSLGRGVKRVRYDGSSAIIEIDNCWFKDGTDLGMRELCGQILQAAKNTHIDRIYVMVKVRGEDKYGNEVTTKHYETILSGRADLDEVAKYQRRDALFDDLGTGVAMKYESIIMQDDNIINQ